MRGLKGIKDVSHRSHQELPAVILLFLMQYQRVKQEIWDQGVIMGPISGLWDLIGSSGTHCGSVN